MLVPLTTAERDLLVAILARYNEIQTDGAGLTPFTSDNVVASKASVDAASASMPPNPLFLPLPVVQAGGLTAQVYRQLADNGMASLFGALIAQGQLLSSRVLVGTRTQYGLAVAMSDTFLTVSDPGQLPHSAGPGEPGAPVTGTQVPRYVELLAPSSNAPMVVAGGPDAGKRIFGLLRAGSSTPGDSVEVEFRARDIGSDPAAASVAYTWESGMPGLINVQYGFRQALDAIDETAFRRTFR